MKVTILFALVGAAVVGAQTAVSVPFPGPTDANACVVGCWNDMIGLISKPLKEDPDRNKFENCKAGDVGCACQQGPDPNFSYGLRDCSRSKCERRLVDVNVAIDVANKQCGTNLGHDTPADIPGSTTAPVVGGANPTAIATSTWTTVVTSGSSVLTSESTTTILGVNGTPVTDGGSPAQTTAPPATTTTDGPAATTDATNTATDGEGSASSSTASGLGAQVTAAPMAGFLAAAGLVAALL